MVANNLKSLALFTLFITSYSPLFLMLIIKQVFTNWSFVNWGGFTEGAILLFMSKFGLSVILMAFVIFGFIGFKITFSNLAKNAENGLPVILKDVKNKNSESIGYIATYIIPFLFQNFDSFYEVFSVIFLLYIIYRIYINSNMILVNPILSIKYALFEIEYEVNGKKGNGLAVSPQKYLNDEDPIKIYEIGHKLYYLT